MVTLNFKIFKLLPCPCLHSIHKVMVLLWDEGTAYKVSKEMDFMVQWLRLRTSTEGCTGPPLVWELRSRMPPGMVKKSLNKRIK